MLKKISSLTTHDLLDEYLSGKTLPEDMCQYGYNLNKHILASQITIDDNKFSEYKNIFMLVLPYILQEVVKDNFYRGSENDNTEYADIYRKSDVRQLFKDNITWGEDTITTYKNNESRIDTSGLSLSHVLVDIQDQYEQLSSTGEVDVREKVAIFSKTYEDDINTYLKKYTYEALKDLKPEEVGENTSSLIKKLYKMLIDAISR